MRNGLGAFVTVTKSIACKHSKMIQPDSLQEMGFWGFESRQRSTHVLKKMRHLPPNVR